LFRALAYVESHLDQDITLESAAEAAFYSPYHFHRLFRKLTGEAFAAYVRRLRLENGAFLLRTGKPVTETALVSGYWTHEAFTRAFRKAFGRPPREFAAYMPPDNASDAFLDRPRRVHFEGARVYAAGGCVWSGLTKTPFLPVNPAVRGRARHRGVSA
jgi:AraC-like DNA-binding protein